MHQTRRVGKNDERDDAIRAAERCGWTVARITKSGYTIMRCACGEHQETLHKTPSNPAHFRQKSARMVSVCCRG
jgi:hypothetical protein